MSGVDFDLLGAGGEAVAAYIVMAARGARKKPNTINRPIWGKGTRPKNADVRMVKLFEWWSAEIGTTVRVGKVFFRLNPERAIESSVLNRFAHVFWGDVFG